MTPPWRAIGSRNQKKAEKREKKKERVSGAHSRVATLIQPSFQRKKLGTVRLRRFLFPTPMMYLCIFHLILTMFRVCGFVGLPVFSDVGR